MSNYPSPGQISKARQLAVESRRGKVLNAEQKALVGWVCDEMSPENFYMDGELFAGDY